MAKEDLQFFREEAWIGDAILILIVREWVLEQGYDFSKGADPLVQQLTSNAFLNRFGRPSEVEARVARHYRKEGLEATRQWILEEWGPHFRRIAAKL